MIGQAREVIQREIDALVSVSDRLGPSFETAVGMILERPGSRVVASGIGKAGIIAHKAVATLASTGTPAFFLHPVDALHGDLGMAAPGDVALLFSYSGESEELTRLLPFLRRRGLRLVAVTKSARSTLGVQADAALELGPVTEACPLGFAPTASTTAMLAMADALAIVLMRARNFTASEYGNLHPAGELGRKAFTVAEVMRGAEALARCAPEWPVRSALEAMSRARTGAALMVDDDGKLLAIFTDGDLRRRLPTTPDLLDRPLKDFAHATSWTIRHDRPAGEARSLMREHRIGELPVLDGEGRVVGLVDLKTLES